MSFLKHFSVCLFAFVCAFNWALPCDISETYTHELYSVALRGEYKSKDSKQSQSQVHIAKNLYISWNQNINHSDTKRRRSVNKIDSIYSRQYFYLFISFLNTTLFVVFYRTVFCVCTCIRARVSVYYYYYLCTMCMHLSEFNWIIYKYSFVIIWLFASFVFTVSVCWPSVAFSSLFFF